MRVISVVRAAPPPQPTPPVLEIIVGLTPEEIQALRAALVQHQLNGPRGLVVDDVYDRLVDVSVESDIN